jgi:hypothetical protein
MLVLLQPAGFEMDMFPTVLPPQVSRRVRFAGPLQNGFWIPKFPEYWFKCRRKRNND